MTLKDSAKFARMVAKPWGYEIIFALTDKYCGKILHIKEGEETSLQYHNAKQETLYLLKGAVTLTDQHGSNILKPGWCVDVLPGVQHRLSAIVDSDVLEASTPELDDVVRIDDKYNRG